VLSARPHTFSQIADSLRISNTTCSTLTQVIFVSTLPFCPPVLQPAPSIHLFQVGHPSTQLLDYVYGRHVPSSTCELLKCSACISRRVQGGMRGSFAELPGGMGNTVCEEVEEGSLSSLIANFESILKPI
jgi:hypothetical protein